MNFIFTVPPPIRPHTTCPASHIHQSQQDDTECIKPILAYKRIQEGNVSCRHYQRTFSVRKVYTLSVTNLKHGSRDHSSCTYISFDYIYFSMFKFIFKHLFFYFSRYITYIMHMIHKLFGFYQAACFLTCFSSLWRQVEKVQLIRGFKIGSDSILM